MILGVVYQHEARLPQAFAFAAGNGALQFLLVAEPFVGGVFPAPLAAPILKGLHRRDVAAPAAVRVLPGHGLAAHQILERLGERPLPRLAVALGRRPKLGDLLLDPLIGEEVAATERDRQDGDRGREKMRPLCSAILGSKSPLRSALRRASVLSSSASVRRL